MKHIRLKKGKIAAFDRGFNNYKTFDEFTANSMFFVTRLKSNTVFESMKENVSHSYIENGLIKDEIIGVSINVSIKENGSNLKTIELRRIAYRNDENKSCFEFVINQFGMNAGHIELIYKKQWQIEFLFKQIK